MNKKKNTEQTYDIYSQHKKKFEKQTNLSDFFSSPKKEEEKTVVSLDDAKEETKLSTENTISLDVFDDEYSDIGEEFEESAYQNDTAISQINPVEKSQAQEEMDVVTEIPEPEEYKEFDDAPIEPKEEKKKFPILKLVFGILGFIALVCFTLFCSQYLSSTATPIKEEIKFNTTKITIKYGEEFKIENYIKDANVYTDIYIEGLDGEKLSSQTITVFAKKDGKDVKGIVDVEVKDVEGPTFSLTTDAVHIKREDINDFECINYVDTDSFADNHDHLKDLSFITACPSLKDLSPGSNGAIIKYKLTDLSGNSTVKNLTVIIDD